MKTTNYFNSFIEVAEDCRLTQAEIPPFKENPTVANLQYNIISNNPYKYTSDDVLFEVHRLRNNISDKELDHERSVFFFKVQPCFRSSPLTKRYGWGIHSDEEGKIALIPFGSNQYSSILLDDSIQKIKAMCSKSKKKLDP